MELAQKLFGLIALAVSGLSLLLNIIAIAIPKWAGEGSESAGFWENCVDDGRGSSKCTSFGDIPDIVIQYIEATRAMMLLGMLFMIASTVCGVLKLFVMKDQTQLAKIAGATAIVAGVFMLIGVIVYGAKTTELSMAISPRFHAGFGLAIVAALIAFIAGFLYLVADNKKQI